MSAIPVRLAHAWAIAWLDIYQAPAVAFESVTSSVSGFFGELARGSEQYPNKANPQSVKVNKLGRTRHYQNEDKSFPFGNPF